MKKNSHSLTAHKVAMMRAAHQILDNPKIFEDPIALKIIVYGFFMTDSRNLIL